MSLIPSLLFAVLRPALGGHFPQRPASFSNSVAFLLGAKGIIKSPLNALCSGLWVIKSVFLKEDIVFAIPGQRTVHAK